MFVFMFKILNKAGKEEKKTKKEKQGAAHRIRGNIPLITPLKYIREAKNILLETKKKRKSGIKALNYRHW